MVQKGKGTGSNIAETKTKTMPSGGLKTWRVRMRELIQGLIHFRNANHEFWFYGSMTILIIAITIYSIFGFKEQFFSIAIGHFGMSVIAMVLVVVLKETSEVYSIDCVWFNGLMCAIYVTLFFY